MTFDGRVVVHRAVLVIGFKCRWVQKRDFYLVDLPRAFVEGMDLEHIRQSRPDAG